MLQSRGLSPPYPTQRCPVASKPPNVWIRFGENGTSVYLKRPWYWGGAHPYTPAKPPKVCVWQRDGQLFSVGCLTRVSRQWVAGQFCPDCGGRIKIKGESR